MHRTASQTSSPGSCPGSSATSAGSDSSGPVSASGSAETSTAGSSCTGSGAAPSISSASSVDASSPGSCPDSSETSTASTGSDSSGPVSSGAVSIGSAAGSSWTGSSGAPSASGTMFVSPDLGSIALQTASSTPAENQSSVSASACRSPMQQATSSARGPADGMAATPADTATEILALASLTTPRIARPSSGAKGAPEAGTAAETSRRRAQHELIASAYDSKKRDAASASDAADCAWASPLRPPIVAKPTPPKPHPSNHLKKRAAVSLWSRPLRHRMHACVLQLAFS